MNPANKKVHVKKFYTISFITLAALLFCLSYAVVASDSSTQDLRFSMINQDPDPVQPGGYVEARFSIQNYGFNSAESVLIEIIPDYPFSLDPGVSAQKDIGTILSRQLGENKVTLFYKLRVDTDAIEGDNKIELRYSLDNGRNWIKLDPFYIRVRNSATLLSIYDVSTDPPRAAPGETVQVNIKVKNNGVSKLKDIKTTLSMYTISSIGTSTSYEELPFTPFDNGVVNIIEGLDAGKTANIGFNFVVNADAANKPYKIPVTIEYSNLFGNNFSETNIVGVVIDKEPEFLLNLEESDIHTNNAKGKIIISLSNVAQSDINYLTMKLAESEDYKIISANTIYLGNLESDDFETAEYEIFVSSDKQTVPIQLEISYKDSYNKMYQKKIVMPGIKLYSKEEAMTLGLTAKPNIAGMVIGLMFAGLVLAFWLYMLIDLVRSKMTGYKKLLWVIVFITANIIGAALYYFVGKKKQQTE